LLRLKYLRQTSAKSLPHIAITSCPRTEQELANIPSDLSPVELNIRERLCHQQEYNKKAAGVEGHVQTVVSISQG
jgi:hypothetical protein